MLKYRATKAVFSFAEKAESVNLFAVIMLFWQIHISRKETKKMKKVMSVVLALVMVLSCTMFASAEPSSPVLRFDDDGEFKILHICDAQDGYPAHGEMLDFINHVLDKYDPDLVILGGDNTVGSAETKEEAIKELVAPFVEHEVYFTLVFGNHDREQGVSNEDLLTMYQKAGGRYCLAYDALPSLSGVGNHNLPIFSSNNIGKVAYNLYMFDSGTGHHKDANGNEGYDCVYSDQIEWFENVNKAYTLANGGNVIPSMAFQHIIVGEIMDVFYKEAGPLSVYTKFCNGKNYDLLLANYGAIKDGVILEPPCPGVENHGQFDALVRQKTVAIFSGHDHVNNFTVNLQGVDIVNTAGATFSSYGNDITRGARLITLHEGKTEYDSQILTVSEEVMDDADISFSKVTAFFSVLFGKIVTAFFAMF